MEDIYIFIMDLLTVRDGKMKLLKWKVEKGDGVPLRHHQNNLFP